MSWSPWGVRCQPWVTAGLLGGVWGWGLVKDVAPTHTLRGTAGLQLGTDGPELASPCPRSGDMGTRGALCLNDVVSCSCSQKQGGDFGAGSDCSGRGTRARPPHSLRG